MNEKTCGSPSNTRKGIISHILETAPTHATEYNFFKGFAQKNINTNNTSVIGKIVKTHMNVLLVYPGNVAVQRTSPYVCYGGSYRK